jgi:hypothetical protein
MSATETRSAKTGLVWWSKLALWILVLVFGVLYLGSVKRNERVDLPAPAAGPASTPAALPPSGAIDLGPPGPSEPSGPAQEVTAEPVSLSSDAQAEQAPRPAEAPEPLRTVESAAFAESLLNKAPGGEVPGASPGSAAEVPGEGSNPNALPPRESPVGAADLGAAQTVQEEIGSPVPQAQPIPVRPVPGPEPGGGSGGTETEEAERARILMEYEAMRRSAEEQMRQHWPPMGPPGGAVFRQGPPVYGPWVYPTR